MIEVIKASKKHIPDIAKINEVLDTPHFCRSNKELIEKNISKEHYFIAVDNKKVLGAMAIILDEGIYEIDSLATSQEKKGIGKMLIDFAVEKCKKEKVPKLWCWSLARYKARGFYKKMGFEEDILLKKHAHGEDCYLFGKIIEI
ncbi:GNAT family N-acetyltransferase [Candidatus Peregrinibacteria bacterium]|nr:GNAT family N-acetyltransferase [Candidatus Peregrinibacteria bacterium]